jgi:HEAT repeat protein
MRATMDDAALALGAAILAITAAVVAVRVVAAFRRRRLMPVRAHVQELVAAQLAGDENSLRALPPGAEEVFVDVAREALEEVRGAERDQLIDILEERGAVDAALARLRARSPATRHAAAEFLSVVQSPRAHAGLVAAVDDRHPSVRLAAAHALAQGGDPSAVADVQRALERDAELTPGAAADVMLALGGRMPAAVGVVARDTRSPELRRIALAVIGELRLAEHAPILREALTSDDDELVARGARGLGLVGEIEAAGDLATLLERRDRPWFVRAAAAKALGLLGDPRVASVLEQQLADESWWVRTNAAEALGHLRVGQPA